MTQIIKSQKIINLQNDALYNNLEIKFPVEIKRKKSKGYKYSMVYFLFCKFLKIS